MPHEHLIATTLQLQTEVENLAIRGIRAVDAEQQKWLAHTRDNLSEMGAEFLATKMTCLLDSIAKSETSGAAELMDLLTTIRVFNRVLTLDSAEKQLAQLVRNSHDGAEELA